MHFARRYAQWLKLGIPQGAIGEFGAGEFPSAHIGGLKIGMAQIGSAEIGRLKLGFAEVDGVENRPHRFHHRQAGALEVRAAPQVECADVELLPRLALTLRPDFVEFHQLSDRPGQILGRKALRQLVRTPSWSASGISLRLMAVPIKMAPRRLMPLMSHWLKSAFSRLAPEKLAALRIALEILALFMVESLKSLSMATAAGQAGVAEIRAAEIGAARVGHGQVFMRGFEFARISRPLASSPFAQIDAFHIGARKVGSFQRSAAQIRAHHAGVAYIGAPQIGAEENGAIERGVAQIRLVKAGPGEIGIRHVPAEEGEAGEIVIG